MSFRAPSWPAGEQSFGDPEAARRGPVAQFFERAVHVVDKVSHFLDTQVFPDDRDRDLSDQLGSAREAEEKRLRQEILRDFDQRFGSTLKD
jgi:hypothetical protein